MRLLDELATIIRVRMLMAMSLMKDNRWDECVPLFGSALACAEGIEGRTSADRSIAVAANNITSALLELEPRTREQDRVLEQGSRAAKRFWLRAGNWINHERADYLCSLVYNALGRYEDARTSALEALAIIRDNGEEPVDQAFINIELAAACRGLGLDEECEEAKKVAQDIARTFESEGLKDWFAKTFSKLA